MYAPALTENKRAFTRPAPAMTPPSQALVIFGLSNILSDLVDCAMAKRLSVARIVIDQP